MTISFALSRTHILRMVGAFLCVGSLGLFCLSQVFSDGSVLVTARVNSTSIPPIITSVSPTGNPVVIARNSLQTFSIGVSADATSSALTYTVTPAVWVVIPESGSVPIHSGNATVPITYLAPSTKAGLTYFIVTVQDATNHTIGSKRVNLYIY